MPLVCRLVANCLLEASLKRLATDYIDLFQTALLRSNDTDRRLTWRARRISSSRKIREIGCSNFSAEPLREAE